MKNRYGSLTRDRRIYRYQFVDVELGNALIILFNDLSEKCEGRYEISRTNHLLEIKQYKNRPFTQKEFRWLDELVHQRIYKDREEEVDEIYWNDCEEEFLVSKKDEQRFNSFYSQITEYLEILFYENEGTQLSVQIKDEMFILYRLNDYYCLETEEELLLSVGVTEDILSEFQEYFFENRYLWI